MTGQNRHKLAILTWSVVYPMITGLLIVLEPILEDLATPLRTLVLTAIMVPAMVYLSMPFVTARFRRWLVAEHFFAMHEQSDPSRVLRHRRRSGKPAGMEG